MKSMPNSSSRSYISLGRWAVARSWLSATGLPHHDGIARHGRRTSGAVRSAWKTAVSRMFERAAEEPVTQRRAAGLLEIGDDLVVHHRPELDEVAVGVDDRVAELAADLRCGEGCCRHEIDLPDERVGGVSGDGRPALSEDTGTFYVLDATGRFDDS